jgi:hypothetical protein
VLKVRLFDFQIVLSANLQCPIKYQTILDMNNFLALNMEFHCCLVEFLGPEIVFVIH